jgi:hypothetical protein
MTEQTYLARNRVLARELIGQQIAKVERRQIVGTDDDDPPRLAWGLALLETNSHKTLLLECEESQSNVIMFEVPPDGGRFRENLSRLNLRAPIATRVATDPLRFMLESPIRQIENVSRVPGPDDRPTYFEMCGLRMTFETGDKVVVGTHLTPEMFPSMAFMLPEEVDPELRYTSLDQ